MKWKDDQYKHIKDRILDILIACLDQEAAQKLSLRTAIDAIEQLFETITKE